MINILTALGWYNQFDGITRLKPGPDVNDLNNGIYSNLDDKKMSQIDTGLERVLVGNLLSVDIRTRCEALVKIGVFKYKRRQFEKAKELMQTAATSLTDKRLTLRLAAVRWMLGMVEFSMKDDHQGYENWNKARNTFQERAIPTGANPLDDIQQWFSDQVWLMNLDLARIPAEALDWANDEKTGGQPTTSIAAQDIIDDLYSLIDSRNFGKAREKIKELAELDIKRPGKDEKGEIELTCGVCYQMMNEPEEALVFLEKARSNFTNKSLQHAATIWIMGTIDWQAGSKVSRAITLWQQASEEFKALQDTSKQHNDQDMVQWYQERLLLMGELLKNQRKDKYPF